MEHIIYRTSDTNSSNSSHTSRNSNLVYCSRCSVMSDFSHLLLVLNSSVNIIIYGWKDKKFRELLLKLFNLECFVKTNSVSVVKMAREKDLTMTQLTVLENQKTLTRSEADLDAHEDENMISYSVL